MLVEGNFSHLKIVYLNTQLGAAARNVALGPSAGHQTRDPVTLV